MQNREKQVKHWSHYGKRGASASPMKQTRELCFRFAPVSPALLLGFVTFSSTVWRFLKQFLYAFCFKSALRCHEPARPQGSPALSHRRGTGRGSYLPGSAMRPPMIPLTLTLSHPGNGVKLVKLLSRRAANEGRPVFQGRLSGTATPIASRRDATNCALSDAGRKRPAYPQPSLRDEKG